MARKLSRWEPFRDMVTLREAMDHLFEDTEPLGWEGTKEFDGERVEPHFFKAFPEAGSKVECQLPVFIFVFPG